MKQNQDFNFELKRKLFHLGSLIFPLIYLFMDRLSMSVLLLIISIVTLYLDISRNYDAKIKGVIENIFGHLLRKEEESGNFALSGASFMALGFLITCLLFAKGLAITSWLILTISDCLAAIFGLRYGTKLSNGKSLVGAGVFFLSTLIISIISFFLVNYYTTFKIIILSSILTTLMEFYSNKIRFNDNLSIPLTYCLSTVFWGLFF